MIIRFSSFLMILAPLFLVSCGNGGSAANSVASDDPPTSALVGTWKVTYTNDFERIYTIFDSGEVKQNDTEKRSGSLKHSHGALLDFNDGKVERLTLAGSRLLVEHFNPASDYPGNRPNQIGLGVRLDR